MLVNMGQTGAQASVALPTSACGDRRKISMLLQPRLQCRQAFQGRLPQKRCGAVQLPRLHLPHQRHGARGPVRVRAGTVVRTLLAPGPRTGLARLLALGVRVRWAGRVSKGSVRREPGAGRSGARGGRDGRCGSAADREAAGGASRQALHPCLPGLLHLTASLTLRWPAWSALS